MSLRSSWDDTIVALATPPGIGAIGVIRLSGARSFQIVNTLFPSKDLSNEATHTIHVGYLKLDTEVLDEVVLSLFKNPRSYTGEDVVEISCHGSPYVQQQVLDAIIAAGARLAKAGEFTLRAFLNGKIDLAQAEAVADLIASGTKASRDTALHAMRGGFSKVLADLREQMIKFSALIELELDFSQEDVEFADRSQFYTLLRQASSVTARLLESFRYGNVIKNGVRVAIVGKPNAGKSTLLNSLLNENRAIVSDIAGTTRDTIEEILNVRGILFRLIDTAGIREHTADIIEKVGMEKTFEKIKEADIIVYVFDASTESGSDLNEFNAQFPGRNILFVGNKVDITGITAAENTFIDFKDIIFISAKNVDDLEILRDRMFDAVISGAADAGDTVVTNARHYTALQNVYASIQDVMKGLDDRLPGDLLSLDIRRCLSYLSDITGGEITNKDQLDYIFSKFCIGK